MSDSFSLIQIIEKILQYTCVDPLLIPNLRSGLSSDDIKEQFKNLEHFPFDIPTSFIELYQWHDGIENQREMFCYHTFLSLAECLEIRSEWNDINLSHQEVGEPDLYEADLLPIFEFEGEYYCIQCHETQQDDGAIWFVYHDSSQVYDSLESMMLSILECYEVKAYKPTFAEYYVDTDIDEEKVSQIKLKYNSCRRKEVEYWSKNSNAFFNPETYYHP